MFHESIITITILVFFNSFSVLGVPIWNYLNIIRTSEVKDLNKLTGPPIEIACIIRDGMSDYARCTTDGKNLGSFIPTLQNNKNLTLFFNSIIEERAINNGLEWVFFNEWHRTTQDNICVISYGHGNDSNDVSNLLPKVKDFVNSHRIEFAGRIVRDFVIGIGLALNRVKMSGFCFGVHVGIHACRYCNAARQQEKEIVEIFVGVDPSRISYYLSSKRYPHSGDANYVMLIHAPEEFPASLFQLGTSQMTGDVDIIVKGLLKFREHLFSMLVFMATAEGDAVLVACRRHRSGNKHQGYEQYENFDSVDLGIDDIIVGIHGIKDDSKLGVFEITLQEEGAILYEHLRM